MSEQLFKLNRLQGGFKKTNILYKKSARVQKNKKRSRFDHSTAITLETSQSGPLFDRSNLIPSWSFTRKAGPGLVNGRNTCFLNSVLECLTYTAPLAQHLLKQGHKNTCRMDGFCALCSMETHVNRSLKEPKSYVKGAAILPSSFTSNLKALSPTLHLERQEDAHEFYMFILSAFQKASIYGLGKLSQPVEESAFIYQIFGGKFRSQLKCNSCYATSNNYEASLDLSLDLNSRINTIQQALANYTKVDIIGSDDDPSNKYKCELCNQMVTAEKRMTIDELPLMCTIHLKRFAYLQQGYIHKIGSKVQFPETLDLAPYVSEDQRVQKAEYNLYAVLVHSGRRCDSGHYYAYIKAPNQHWYKADDESVTPVKLEEVLNQQAYMLFYQKVQPESTSELPPITSFKAPRKEIIPAKKVLVKRQRPIEFDGQVATETTTANATPNITTTTESAAKSTVTSTTTAETSTVPTHPTKKRKLQFIEPTVIADNPKAWVVQFTMQPHRSLRGNLSPPTYSANVSDLSSWLVQSTSDFQHHQKSNNRLCRSKLKSKKSTWTETSL